MGQNGTKRHRMGGRGMRWEAIASWWELLSFTPVSSKTIFQFCDLLTKPATRQRAPGFATTRHPGSIHSQKAPVLLAPPVCPVLDPPPPPEPPTEAAPELEVPEALQEPPFRLPQQVTPSAAELRAIALILGIYEHQLAPSPIAQELLASSPAKPVHRHVRERLEALEQARQHISQASAVLLRLCRP